MAGAQNAVMLSHRSRDTLSDLAQLARGEREESAREAFVLIAASFLIISMMEWDAWGPINGALVERDSGIEADCGKLLRDFPLHMMLESSLPPGRLLSASESVRCMRSDRACSDGHRRGC